MATWERHIWDDFRISTDFSPAVSSQQPRRPGPSHGLIFRAIAPSSTVRSHTISVLLLLRSSALAGESQHRHLQWQRVPPALRSCNAKDPFSSSSTVSLARSWATCGRTRALDVGASARPIRAEQSHAAGRQAEYRRIESAGDYGVSASQPAVHAVGRWDPDCSSERRMATLRRHF